MVGRSLVLIDCLTSETRTAVVLDDSPVAFNVHPPAMSPRFGDVYAVRTRNVTGGGVFLELGNGIDGFIPVHLLKGRSLGEGDLLLAEIRREGVRGKGCRLAPLDEPLPDGAQPGKVRAGDGPALEAIEWLDDDQIAEIRFEGIDQAMADMREEIVARRPALSDRITRYTGARPLFEAEAVDVHYWALDDPHMSLPGGGALSIEPTAALVAIDIDSGPSSLTQANKAAVEATCRAIRLRGLAGVMMIDPAGSNDRRQGFKMAEALEAAFSAQRLEAEIKGVTRAGLVEIVRPMRREGIAATLKRLRTRVYQAFRAAHGAQASAPGRAITIRANVDFIELMSRDTFAPEREAYRARHGLDLRTEVDNAMARGVFEAVDQPI